MDVRAALLNIDKSYEFPVSSLAGPRGPQRGNFVLPATPLSALGDASFAADHGLRCNYMAGAMANGIASVELVTALGRAGLLGIYGAAGQAPHTVAAALAALQKELGDRPFGVNLIHSPAEPAVEEAVVDLFLERGLRLVEASAFLKLTLPIVRYRLAGIRRDADGRVVAPNRVIAKVSRIEVATQFLSPAPEAMVAELVRRGDLTPAQAEMAREIPMAQDLTAEADSGGHTDNRPAVALIPTMLALAERLQTQFGYKDRLRVGAAGGIATPASVAAAFAMGAAYVVTGSINQACRESGTSDLVRAMLATAGPADIAMAPAADMFEMGVKVQVLKHGTMFPMRATRLYELYQKYRTIDELPAKEREQVETQLFRTSLAQVWDETKAYFAVREPGQIDRGERDPRHKLALICRSYLGRASHWANQGVLDRRFDFQVWCGPAMGAFNEWARGTALEHPDARTVTTVAMNLMFGAAVQTRAYILKAQGADPARVPSGFAPLPAEQLWPLIESGV